MVVFASVIWSERILLFSSPPSRTVSSIISRHQRFMFVPSAVAVACLGHQGDLKESQTYLFLTGCRCMCVCRGVICSKGRQKGRIGDAKPLRCSGCRDNEGGASPLSLSNHPFSRCAPVLYVRYVCVYNPFCFLCSRNRISKSKFRLVHVVYRGFPPPMPLLLACVCVCVWSLDACVCFSCEHKHLQTID